MTNLSNQNQNTMNGGVNMTTANQNQTNIQGGMNMDAMTMAFEGIKGMTNEQRAELTMALVGSLPAEVKAQLMGNNAPQNINQNQGGVQMNNQTTNQNTNQGGVNMNNQGTVVLTQEAFNAMVQQLATAQAQQNQQQGVTPQPVIDPAVQAEITKIQGQIAHYQQQADFLDKFGKPGDSAVFHNLINGCKAQLQALTGAIGSAAAGTLQGAQNGLDAIGAYGQNRIADQFIPSTINTTSGAICDILNALADAVQGYGQTAIEYAAQVGGATVNAGSGVLRTTANTVGQIGSTASSAAQNYAGNAFGLIRK